MRTSKAKPALQLVKSSFHPAIAGAVRGSRPVSPATPDCYGYIENFAHELRGTADAGSLLGLLNQALGETRTLNDDVATRVASLKLACAERKIEALKKELEELRGLVHVDHLTGALNRSGLDQAYRREAARADRGDTPLGIALLDIDDFKALNDRRGHQAGDAALVHFAQIIRRAMRPSDTVVRYGGEEFLFLLPDSNPGQTAKALCRLQQDLERNPLVFKNRKLPITFSAGIAVRKRGETRDEVISRADHALYKAKGAGKNRAVTAE